MDRVDLNCDLGESFGAYTIGADESVLPYITSASVACGFHGGDPAVMRQTVDRAKALDVAIGAHPGLPDLVGFGRRAMDITPDDAYDMVVYQIGALAAFASAAGTRLRHVKPHGALYNMAAVKRELADAIARAVHDVDRDLVLFGLAGSQLLSAADAVGLRAASEAFADRNYMPDGTLVSRRRADAQIADTRDAVHRAVRLVLDGQVRSIDGTDIPVRAETICIHGDGPHAADFARALRSAFESEGIVVRAPQR